MPWLVPVLREAATLTGLAIAAALMACGLLYLLQLVRALPA